MAQAVSFAVPVACQAVEKTLDLTTSGTQTA